VLWRDEKRAPFEYLNAYYGLLGRSIQTKGIGTCSVPMRVFVHTVCAPLSMVGDANRDETARRRPLLLLLLLVPGQETLLVLVL
jgi:hypothetical protein